MATKFDPKAKAKRQKIMLAVLGVVFIAVLAWQVPSVLKIMNKKPPAAATTPPPAATPVPVPGAVPATPPTGTPVSATPAPAGALADSDPAPQAAGGQLVTFDRFASKDPFAQQVGVACEGDSTGSETSACSTPAPAEQSDSEKASGTKLTLAPVKQPDAAPQASAAPATARISVNGVSELVSVGGTFPKDDPLFSLVSVSATTAKVGISGGSLNTGGGTVTLTKGKKLILENTVDGARYVLVLVSTS